MDIYLWWWHQAIIQFFLYLINQLKFDAKHNSNKSFYQIKNLCKKLWNLAFFLQISNELMFFKRSPFQFAFKNSFIHKIDQDFILLSENNEEIGDYAAWDLEIMNTKEATAYFCWYFSFLNKYCSPQNCDVLPYCFLKIICF